MDVPVCMAVNQEFVLEQLRLPKAVDDLERWKERYLLPYVIVLISDFARDVKNRLENLKLACPIERKVQ